MLRVAYLTVYNGIGLVGWTYILSQMITIISTGRYTKLWKEQGTTILVRGLHYGAHCNQQY